MNTKPKPFDVISSGTLRDSDLLDAMLDTLETYRPVKYREMIAQGRGYLAKYGDFGYLSYIQGESDELDSMSWLIYETLPRAMDDITPNDCYYGSHPGDGALIGFWPDEDSPLWE